LDQANQLEPQVHLEAASKPHPLSTFITAQPESLILMALCHRG